MLDSGDRTLLFDALRSPDGYRLDRAIGTTYSLDLVALLAAPLGFTIAEWRGNPRAEWSNTDSLAVLKTLRAYASRMLLFCDAARTNVPQRQSPLFTLVEQCVVPVRASMPGHAFHPKVWVLRLVPEQDREQPILFRVLVSTRNLTFDRCLDAIAVLQGELTDRQRGYSANRELGVFLEALPALATRPVAESAQRVVRSIAEEVRRVKFEPQPPFDEYSLHCLGIEGGTKDFNLFHQPKRRLVVSPFVRASTLEELCSDGAEHTLISRADELDRIPKKTLDQFEQILVPRAEMLEVEQEEDGITGDSLRVSDLHAKIYVEDLVGYRTRVLVGSANATAAAFRGNVEFVAVLEGPTKAIGIAKLLQADRDGSDFADLWEKYQRRADVVVDNELEALEEQLDRARTMLAACRWQVRVEETSEKGRFGCVLRATVGFDATFLDGIRCRVWPVLVRETSSVELSSEGVATVSPLSFEALTAFWAFELTFSNRSAPTCRFTVHAELIGEPDRRVERVTEYLISDQAALIQFLKLLLVLDDAADVIGAESGVAVETGGQNGKPLDVESAALLEPLLRTLERRPERLDDIESVLNDLRATEEGKAKLSPEVEAVWAAIWEARKAVAR